MLCWRSSSGGGASPKRSRLVRFERRRSCSSYVARIPWRSIAFATRSARCVNTRFMRAESFVRCLCMVLSRPSGRQSPTLPAATGDLRLLPLPGRAAATRGARARAGRGRRATRSTASTTSPTADTASATTSSGRRPAPWARIAGAAVKRGLERAGGYGGDFATVLASLRRANRADVIFSTVDTVGIPLMLIDRARAGAAAASSTSRSGFRSASHGCGRSACERLYARALGRRRLSLAYSEHEVEELRRWLAAYGAVTRVEFVPFGVDDAGLRAEPTPPPSVDVVSVGADPHRDFELLLTVARAMPDTHAFASSRRPTARARSAKVPSNCRARERPAVRRDAPPPRGGARSLRSPSATTATRGRRRCCSRQWRLAKPVVVSRTKAVASGYGLVDGENVPARRAGGRSGASGARSARCCATSGLRARSARRHGATVERRAHAGSATSGASRRCSRRLPTLPLVRPLKRYPRRA